MNHQNNIERIKTVFDSLGDLQNKVVFVGGATVSFYADRQTFEIRETDDVDVIVELLSYSSHASFEEKLRNLGFLHDIASGVICRYRIQGIIVDIMPTTHDTFGFSNKWYPDGFNDAIDYEIDAHQIVKILSPAYFIATNWRHLKVGGQAMGGPVRTLKILYTSWKTGVAYGKKCNVLRKLLKNICIQNLSS